MFPVSSVFQSGTGLSCIKWLRIAGIILCNWMLGHFYYLFFLGINNIPLNSPLLLLLGELTFNIIVYYINTNEIAGELLREKMISSHVKMWKDLRCYGYIINCAFRSKNDYLSEMVWHFIGVYAHTWREISYLRAAMQYPLYNQMRCSLSL